MDRFLHPQSPEAKAHSHLNENWFTWDTELPSLNETLIAGCASYEAFQRYLSGSDLYLLPRSRAELESILKRYAYDTIHNTIAKARTPLERGGYSRACHLSEKSIANVLNQNDNAAFLLGLHSPQMTHITDVAEDMTRPATRPIRIK